MVIKNQNDTLYCTLCICHDDAAMHMGIILIICLYIKMVIVLQGLKYMNWSRRPSFGGYDYAL